MTKTEISEYFKFLEQASPFLDGKTLADARYVEHGQWELPFEATLLGLMKSPIQTINIDLKLANELAIAAGIEADGGVLDPETWKRFQIWSAA